MKHAVLALLGTSPGPTLCPSSHQRTESNGYPPADRTPQRNP